MHAAPADLAFGGEALAFTLGETKDPAAESAMAVLARNAGTNALVRDALISGLAVREVELLERLAADKAWADKNKVGGGEGFIGTLARNVFQQARGDRVNRLLELVTRKDTPQWQTLAVFASAGAEPPRGKKGEPPPRVKYVRLATEPPALAQLAASSDKAVQAAVKKLDKVSSQSATARVFKLKSADPDKIVEELTLAGLGRFPDERERRKRSALFWEERNAWYSDVWFDLKGTGQTLRKAGLRERSAAFPFELAYRLISMFSIAGDTVLDPFLGTGTTMLAAMTAARHSVGHEIDPAFLAPVTEAVRTARKVSATRAAERLRSHHAFVRQRVRAGSPPGHANEPHDVPVMSAQEAMLTLSVVDHVEELALGRWRAAHRFPGPVAPQT